MAIHEGFFNGITNDPSEAESNLVIPLHKREGETESADGKKAPLINRNRIPGAESMVPFRTQPKA